METESASELKSAAAQFFGRPKKRQVRRTPYALAALYSLVCLRVGCLYALSATSHRVSLRVELRKDGEVD